MKNALLIVTLPLVLSACASWSQRPELPPLGASDAAASGFSTDGKLAKKQQVSRHSAGATSEPRVEDPLPSAELTEEVMYKVLSAEIAYQRGDWQTSYVTMLGLAQQTRDPRLARRAAEIALSAKEADEALAAVRLWRTLAPHSDEATQYYLSFIILSEVFYV